MPTPMPHLLRSDAQENRDRVLTAARELFAETGLEATMRQIARRAQVGPATLYRRFPTKQHLILEAFDDELTQCRSIVQDGAADPDPWRGLRSIVERTLVLNAHNHGFTDAFLGAYPDAVDLAGHRQEMATLVATVARAARAAGDLRTDFVFDDFLLILHAGRGLASLPRATRPAAARRLARLIIDGLSARTTHL